MNLFWVDKDYLMRDLHLISEVNKDDLQTLPSTRQRNSLITFGKNLHDLPDDPNDVIKESPIANPTIMTSLSMLPPKKRLTPDGGFGISRLGFGCSEKRRQLITLERARYISSMTKCSLS